MKPKASQTHVELPNTLQNGRITRTLWPPQAGTKRWTRIYGANLLCVRYRHDTSGLRRVVTVELVVGQVARRKGQPKILGSALYPITVHPHERRLKLEVVARGGRWDREFQCWYAPGLAICQLNLEDRIQMKGASRQAKKS